MIVVPTTSLVEQMYKDLLIILGMQNTTAIKFMQDLKKVSDKPVTITTWQSFIKCKRIF